MLNAILLSIIEEAGAAVLTMTGSLEQGELLNSRLTRREVSRQILIIAENADRLPGETRKRMAELDWEGWAVTAKQIKREGKEADEALWFAVRSLVPAMLINLRLYRKTQPDLFSWIPASLHDETN
ncbi:hypothetical protein [Methylococcus sp. EFPC2]|uniref:hypothetical protein n=1 Tax=Methylococcus sp. EFPC2 TaxID=2812648 RepID=UPI0019678982|nr:hypothetical protein [Methylococcus sp. EFPC2]QSA99246.1 hypothetical protein JWZ97_19680 [Methylococcus sp. EFPC2]